MASADQLQRPLDANAQKISNLGTPTAVGDATFVDLTVTPLVESGSGSPGVSRLASAADHVHPTGGGGPGGGDPTWRLTADDSIAADKMRVFAGDYQIEDTKTLTVEDGGFLAVT